jgi:hypothetical protein
MMAKHVDRHEDRAPRLNAAALSMLLGFVAFMDFAASTGVVMGMVATKTFWGPSVRTMCLIGVLLLIGACAMWGSLRLKPTKLKAAVLSAWLGISALIGFAQTAGVIEVLRVTKTFWGPWHWQIPCLLAMDLVIGVGAIWGLLSHKRWKGWEGLDEPVSPATRRTNKLFGLSGLVGIVSAVAVLLGTHGTEPFSNRQISTGVAIFAIASWMLAQAISWWWYLSADEHERRANDFGFLVGGGLFLAVTPAWWVAARAGLLSQPDAMILWSVFVAAMTIGWFWHRYR